MYNTTFKYSKKVGTQNLKSIEKCPNKMFDYLFQKFV